MQFIISHTTLLGSLAAALALPIDYIDAHSYRVFTLPGKSTSEKDSTADGVVELCPQPDYQGDCFSWGYNHTVCCTRSQFLHHVPHSLTILLFQTQSLAMLRSSQP